MNRALTAARRLLAPLAVAAMLLGLASNAAAQAPTGVTLSVNPATVTESADATTITLTATVDGGTFAVERVVGFSTAGSGSGSTATPNDYTSVGFTPLTIPANMASASTTIEFTAAVDMVAEPSGETVVIVGILQLPNSQDSDTSIPVTSATITINDPAANIAPIYSSVIFGSLSYVQNRMISPTTLPAVTTPGNGDTVYSMAVLPAGLTFDAATRAIIGTPTVAVVQTSYTLTAHDSDDDNAASDSATFPVRITVQADLTPTFTGVDVPAQVFRAGQRVDVTLPAATGGDGALTYTLTGPSAAALATALPGATFTASTRVLSGVLTGNAFAATAFIYTATDQDSDEATATLMITVEANKAPAYPEGTTFAAQVFFPNQVVDLTLPGITPGTGDISITYTLTPALPDGLTFNAANSMRTITGTTTAAAVATTPYTLTVTDGDTNTEVGDTATLMFTITVEADTAPAFADGEMIDQQNFMQNVAITPVTLPAASGGNGALTYTLTAATPVAGLTLDPTTRVLSGTPTAATGTTLINMLVVMDADANEAADDGDTLNFLINVEADPRPSFTGVTVDDQNFFAGELIDVTLPAVSGGAGAGAITYTLTGPSAAALATALPGATLDSATRVLSGKLTGPAATARAFTYTATNADGADSTTFMVTIAANKLPLFPVGASIDDQFFLTTVPVALTLPGVISGSGDVSIHYAITPDLPAGLTFNAAASVRTITGTPTAVAAVTTHTLTVTDGDTNVPGDSDMLTFTITVEVDSAPAFADGTTIPEQRYTQGVMITPLTFPEATGGNAPLTYTLTRPDPLPPGLTFDADARPPTLTGTTTLGEVRSGVLSRLTVTDNDGDSTFLPFVLHLDATDTVPTYAADVSIPDIVYVTGEVVDQTLPRPDGGNTPIVYSLTPALPPGLTFVIGRDPATITGTVGANAIASVDYTLTAADSDTTGGAGDEDTLMFSITVEEDTAPAFATNAEIPALASYPRGAAITPLTFPEATGGNGDLTYALTSTGAMPAGLTFNGDARPPTLTGTPGFAGSVIYSYTVTDADDNTVGTDSAVLTFTFVATASATTLNFPSSTHTLHYPLGAAITPTTFPAATAGTAPLTYAVVSGDMPPAGLTFDSTNRILSGTPSAAGSSSFTYRVTDSATPTPDNDLLETTIVICESGGAADGGTTCTPPAFVTLVLPAVAEQAFQQILPITTPVTLPEATGGSGASPVRIYTLTPLPAGLAFDPATRAISGRPEAVGTTTVNYRVGDAGAGNADTQSTTVMFDIVVFGRPLLPAPGSVVYAVGDTVALTLTTGQRGTPPYTYALSTQGTGGALTLPAGLTFNGDPRPPTITGMPTAVTALLRYSYEVTDSRGVTNSSTFSITVNAAADTAPDFGTATVADQTYTVGTAIPDLTLPEVATPGNGATTYILTAPPGLNFDPMTRVLSGTPTTAAGVTTYSYTARDEDESPDTLAILITVNAAAAAPTAFTLAITPATVTESATATDLTATVALTGGTFAVERVVTVGETTGGSATSGTDYTAVTDTNVTIPAMMTTASATIPFTAADDMETEAGGETVNFDGSLRTADGMGFSTTFAVATASITINDPVVAPSTQTLTLNPTAVTESATPTDITATVILNGGTFPVERLFTLGAQGGTAAINDDFEGLSSVNLTIPANATSGTRTFPFTALADSVADDGETVMISSTLTAVGGVGRDNTGFDSAFATLTINDPPAAEDTAPAFVAGAAIEAATFYQDTNITPLTLPRATGGEGAITYALTPAIPGMFFDTVTGVLSGAPTTEAAATTYTYTAGDTDGSAAGTDESSLTISITVLANTIPEFSIIRGPRYIFTVGTVVNQTLPEATGGDSTLIYTITRALPDGLTFNAAATPPTITGTPTTAASSVTYRYNVDDSDANTAGDDGSSLSFRITIRGAPATGITMTIRDLAGNEITSLNEDADPTTFRLHFDTVPALSGFTADQDVAITVSTPVAGQVGYTAAGRSDFIDRDVASESSGQLQLTVTDDDVATADGVVTYTATVSPSGFTATAMITLVDNEISIVTTPSTVTLATGATADYTVQLDQEPPGSVTVSVVSVGDAIATVSRNTRVFTAANWNAPAPITVTGMRGGSTTISHSATAAGGFGYQSTDVMVTVTPVAVNFDADESIPDQIYTVGTAIDSLTLPTATGATTYRLSSHADQSLPAGLTFDGATRVLSGIPTAAQVAEGYVYSARNPDNLDNLNFDITVEATGTPTTPPTGQTLSLNPTAVTESATATDITATVTLTGGAYTVARSFSIGSSSGSATEGTDYTALSNVVLTIPANLASGTVTFPFTAADDMTVEGGGEALTIRSTLLIVAGTDPDTSLAVANAIINIRDPVAADTAPAFAADAAVAAQTFTVGTAVDLTLPEATGGEDGIVYTLSTALPAGLTFNSGTRVLDGTPTAVATAATYFYRAADGDGNNMPSDSVLLTFTITVSADTAPAFAGNAAIEAQTYAALTAITPLTLPTATGGNGDITYTLTPAIPGLTLDAATGVLTGMPTTEATATTYTYTAADGDDNTAAGDEVSLTFSLTVTVAIPTGVVMSVNPTMVMESATPTAVMLTATVTGGTFNVARVVRWRINDGTASRFTDYTRIGNTDLTIPANMVSGTATFQFSATVDSVAEPAGETVRIEGGVLTIAQTGTDSSLSFTPAILTINDAPAPGTDTTPAFSTTVSAQVYSVGTAVNLTLPAATDGNGVITYTLAPTALAAGLTFNPAANPPTITGTPNTQASATTYTYTATDEDGDDASLAFAISVGAAPVDATPAFANGARIPTQDFTVDVRIASLSLPQATGGDAPLTYTLTPALSAGLTFDGTARTITGTPTTAATLVTYRYTVTDMDGDTATLTFRVTVVASTGPSFGSATVGDQTYFAGTAITSLTLPVATGGTGTITYTLTPAIPGLTLNPTSRVLTGTPTTVAGATMHTYTATDGDMNTATLMFSITIDAADTAPAFAVTSIPAQTLLQNIAIPAVTLPEATGGNGALTYTLTPTIPGLTLNPSTRVLTGTPTTDAGATDYTYTAADSDGNEAGTDEVSLMFSITVTANQVPAFSAGATIPAQTYTMDMEITALTLPTATGGDVPITYALTGPNDMDASELPPGLAFDTATRVLSGTPTTATVPLTFTWTAADTDANTAADGDAATLTFTITVNPAGIPPVVIAALNQAILPEATRALVNSTTSSITQRIGRAVGGAPQVGSLNFAGQSMGGQDSLAAALHTHGEAMTTDSRDIKEMLADSEFVLPLNPIGTGGGSSLAFWGSGEYLNFSGGSNDLDWSGDLSGVQLGLDARLRDDLLLGVAVSLLESDADYKGAATGSGEYTVDMTSMHPYIGWSSGGLDWWATVGAGSGELEITSQATGMPSLQQKSDIDMQTISVGSSLSFQAGATTLRLKGEVAESQVEVEGGGGIDELQVGASRIRVAMEVGQSRRLPGGRVFEPSVEVAMRYDDGDGETGGGAEIGGGLRYDNPARRFTVDGRARALLGHGGGYEEWGVSGTLRVASGADGQGASFSVSPGYGISGSGIQELWRQGLADDDAATTTDDYAMKLDARVGYGFGFALNEHHGILTPYSEMTLGTTDSYRMGLNWKTGTRFDLTLLGERSQPSTDPVEHAVLLKGELRF